MLSKTCLRLAVFLCTLTLALLVTRFFLAPPHVAVTMRPAPPVGAAAPARLDYKVLLVTMERRGKSYTSLNVVRDPHTPAPARLRVWTYFFTAHGDRIFAADAVEVPAPFAQADQALLTVAAPCRACGPDENLYARVHVAPISPAGDYERPEKLDLDIRTATPVVVAHGQKRRR